MSANIGAIEFLLSDDGHFWIPSECWAVPKAGAKATDLDAWDISLTDPGSSPKLHITDLKRWMLFGTKPERFFHLSPHSSKSTDARRIRREDALSRYLQAVLATLPPEHRDASVAILTPAIRDQKEAKRYHEAIRRILPAARLLPEPEMVVDYFRLVQRSLTLDPERNNVILVIDIGASTSNATIVMSNRGGDVIGGDFQKQRENRLRAIAGTCGDKAGSWVNERLAFHAGLQTSGLPFAKRERIFRHIEQAKIAVSRFGRTVHIQSEANDRGYDLTVGDVEQVAKQVVAGLQPVLAELKERLWKQMTGTSNAQRLSASVLRERGVINADSALGLVDFVLLAGGTSRLRGFREELATLFGRQPPKILEVGEGYAVAAAVGAIAHICHAKYKPTRIHHAGPVDAMEQPPLEGALSVDIQFAWKPQKSKEGEKENRQTILERGDPIVYSEGELQDALELPVDAQVELRARLIPNIGIKRHKKGLSPQSVIPQVSNPSLGFRIDSQRNMVMTGTRVTSISNVRIDLKRFDMIEELAPTIHQNGIPAGQLAFDEIDEVVLDFGMSKTVAVAVRTGLLDPRDLDRLMTSGAPASGVSTRQAIVPPQRPPVLHAEPHPPADPASLPITEIFVEPATPSELVAPASGDSATNLDLSVMDTDRARAGEQAMLVPTTSVSSTDALPQPVGALTAPLSGKTASASIVPAEDERRDSSLSTLPSTVGSAESSAPIEKPSTNSISPPSLTNASVPATHHLQRTTQGFIAALQDFLSAAGNEGVDVPERDLMFTLLGLSVRPFLLLAGPPGCGKSTLARIVAHLLGREPGRTFHEVPVQAHWVSDIPLFGQRGILRPICQDLNSTHFVLFDEVNLTRPEYYLSRMLHALEAPAEEQISGLRLASTFCIGTLNIDDTSRPPSPKIIDRCFLVEVEAVLHTHELRPGGSAILPKLPKLPGLPDAWKSPSVDLDPILQTLIEQLERTVREQGLRQDLLPSRRVLGDIQKVIALYTQLSSESSILLTREELIDRLITSRILVKIAGPIEQVDAAIQCVEKVIKPEEARFKRTMNRISLANQQKRLGFVSPWH